MFCKTHWKQMLHGCHCLLGRNIQRCLFSACTSALGFYFPFLQWFLKNATTQGEQYFKTFSQSLWIPLLPSLQHSASSKEAAPTDESAAGKRKQPCLLGNSSLKRKAWWLLPQCPAFLEWLLAWFWGMCFTCSHSGMGKGRNLTLVSKWDRGGRKWSLWGNWGSPW